MVPNHTPVFHRSCSLKCLLQRLLQIPDDILRVLQSHREPEEVVCDLHPGPLLPVQVVVAQLGRDVDVGVGAAEAWGGVDQANGLQESRNGCSLSTSVLSITVKT